MRILHTLVPAGALAAVALSATLIGSSAASADTGPTHSGARLTGVVKPAGEVRPAIVGVCNPGCSANATFDAYGEKFTVHDYEEDHHSTAGNLFTWNGSAWVLHGTVINSNGYTGAPVTKNYSIPEGTDVAFDACLYEKSSGQFDCSNFYYTKA